MQQFGVDEAGKGPVLGPMVAACVVADPTMLPTGIDDSKALSPTRREALARTLRDDSDVHISVSRVSPDRIDDPTMDMNTLTVAAHAEALGSVVSAIASERDSAVLDGFSGVVDGADTNADRFARRVRNRVSDEMDSYNKVDIHAEHGADETYPLVGAASVIAKVERDGAVDALKEEYGDIGSGYPSDPTTRAFLAEYVCEHRRLPACARASWKTSEDVLACAEQSTLDSF